MGRTDGHWNVLHTSRKSHALAFIAGAQRSKPKLASTGLKNAINLARFNIASRLGNEHIKQRAVEALFKDGSPCFYGTLDPCGYFTLHPSSQSLTLGRPTRRSGKPGGHRQRPRHRELDPPLPRLLHRPSVIPAVCKRGGIHRR
jgi:hypothetical protein